MFVLRAPTRHPIPRRLTGRQCARPAAASRARGHETTLILAAAAMIAGAALDPAQAQQAGTKRTDLQRHDLSAPGREVIQVRVDFDPGYVAPRHTHPGEEIIYVLEGTLEYEIGSEPPVTVKPGDVLFVPAGTVHTAKNPLLSRRPQTADLDRACR
jgi:quercetin dioxygenase-like cupin family protein